MLTNRRLFQDHCYGSQRQYVPRDEHDRLRSNCSFVRPVQHPDSEVVFQAGNLAEQWGVAPAVMAHRTISYASLVYSESSQLRDQVWHSFSGSTRAFATGSDSRHSSFSKTLRIQVRLNSSVISIYQDPNSMVIQAHQSSRLVVQS